MTKKEKETEKYMIQLCKEADVYYDADFNTHMDEPEFNKLLKRDIQNTLNEMIELGICKQVGDEYVYTNENK